VWIILHTKGGAMKQIPGFARRDNLEEKRQRRSLREIEGGVVVVVWIAWQTL
jgi:hypothetical protein